MIFFLIGTGTIVGNSVSRPHFGFTAQRMALKMEQSVRTVGAAQAWAYVFLLPVEIFDVMAVIDQGSAAYAY